MTDDGWIEVRWYDRSDLPALTRIHAICYPQENWTEQDFLRFAVKPGRVLKVIVKEDGERIGSLLYKLLPREARLTRVAVLPEYRRQRIGTYAARMLVGPWVPGKRKVFKARVRGHNDAGRCFLQSIGFRFARHDDFAIDCKVKVVNDEGVEEELETREDIFHFRLDKSPVRHRKIVPALEAVTT